MVHKLKDAEELEVRIVKQCPLYVICFQKCVSVEAHTHYITLSCIVASKFIESFENVNCYCIRYPPENMTDLSFVFWESCPGGGWGPGGWMDSWPDLRISVFPGPILAAESIAWRFHQRLNQFLCCMPDPAEPSSALLTRSLWLTQPLYTFFQMKKTL